MNRIAMSRAASALLRALLSRAGCEADRILLSDVRSVDWQSLTLTGERHTIALRVAGPDAEAIGRALAAGLEEAEFAIPGQIVADIGVAHGPVVGNDGAIALAIEALTIAE